MSQNPIPQWLVKQYDRAKANGWIPFFREAAAKYGSTVEDLMGVGSRESELSNIKGDYHDGEYHGFGIMQLDIDSHKRFVRSGDWADPQKNIFKGAEALAEKRNLIIAASKQKTCTIKFRSGKTAKFTPKPFTGEELRRMTLASYNCGMAAYYHFSLGNDVDRGTAKKNYSADVLERSKDFRDLLARDSFGKTANDRVIETGAAEGITPISHPAAPAPEIDTTHFDTLKAKYDAHADLVTSPSAKTVAKKAGTTFLTKIGVIWGTTAGKIALVLTGVAVLTTLGYVAYIYREQIKTFARGFKTWISKK